METTLHPTTPTLAMSPNPTTTAPVFTPTRLQTWLGRVLTGIPCLFLVWGGVLSFTNMPEVIEGTERTGFSRGSLPVLGAIELVCVALLAFRRTRVFGAVLVSAYLGGAVATHVRLGDPLLSTALFPVYFALAIWGGLYLRDARVRALSPFAH